ncbi:MAG: hypothetical protein H6865_01975 [Rhodospirillales bacterium]|nr:hypothetical protein [Alphaproteobacteria bacterium]MCB9986386.1 hypothetical protein [Rhodospirillales bacterium]USO07065.1 MAG: hypothetical protein H6866_06410 [Rhodospirillales bacterium]
MTKSPLSVLHGARSGHTTAQDLKAWVFHGAPGAGHDRIAGAIAARLPEHARAATLEIRDLDQHALLLERGIDRGSSLMIQDLQDAAATFALIDRLQGAGYHVRLVSAWAPLALCDTHLHQSARDLSARVAALASLEGLSDRAKAADIYYWTHSSYDPGCVLQIRHLPLVEPQIKVTTDHPNLLLRAIKQMEQEENGQVVAAWLRRTAGRLLDRAARPIMPSGL